MSPTYESKMLAQAERERERERAAALQVHELELSRYIPLLPQAREIKITQVNTARNRATDRGRLGVSNGPSVANKAAYVAVYKMRGSNGEGRHHHSSAAAVSWSGQQQQLSSHAEPVSPASSSAVVIIAMAREEELKVRTKALA